jgi:hypothetical protein
MPITITTKDDIEVALLHCNPLEKHFSNVFPKSFIFLLRILNIVFSKYLQNKALKRQLKKGI